MLLDPNTINADGQRTDHDWINEASGIIWSSNVQKNEPCPVWDPASPVTDTNVELNSTYNEASTSSYPPTQETYTPNPDFRAAPVQPVLEATSSAMSGVELSQVLASISKQISQVLECVQDYRLPAQPDSRTQNIRPSSSPAPKEAESSLRTSAEDVSSHEFMSFLVNSTQDISGENVSEDRRKKTHFDTLHCFPGPLIRDGTMLLDPNTINADGQRTDHDWINEASGIIWSSNVQKNEPCPVWDPASPVTDTNVELNSTYNEASTSSYPPPQETYTPNTDFGAAPVQPVLEATSSAKSGPEEQTEKASGFFSKVIALFTGGNVRQAVLPDDKKKRFVFDKDTNRWVDTENPDEETETPALPPKSIFAGQPKVVQSVSRSPARTRLSVRNKKVQSKTVCGHPQQSAPLFTTLAVSDLPDDEN